MQNTDTKKVSIKKTIASITVLALCSATVAFVLLIAPPNNFKEPSTVEIEEGKSLSDIAEKMHEEHIIRSPFWFRAFVILYQGERRVPAGQYYFNSPEPVYQIARRVSDGDFGMKPLRATIIEGWNLYHIADYLEERFVMFDRDLFFSIVKEGYLAPDTYFFFPLSTTEQLVEKMSKNFDLKMGKIKEEMVIDRPLEDILIMASILEAEANTVESKRKVSDILWRRLEADMPLQVDATFIYINNKNTYQLTLDDLQIDNPYNTYKFTGLPPTPINNPSINAIKAAIDPLENPYWYFLSDLSGNMYYGRDFDEHQYNRANYLRR